MMGYAVKTNRRRFTITTIVGVVAAALIVLGVFAIFGKKPSNMTSDLMIGKTIEKSIKTAAPALRNASVWDGSGGSIWTNGSGTESDPYLIESAEHLAYLQKATTTNTNAVQLATTYDAMYGVYFKQTVDIDLNASGGYSWVPIGSDDVKKDTGIDTYDGLGLHYDGGGHIIGNVSIDPTATRFGIFNELTALTESTSSSYNSDVASVSNLTVIYNQQSPVTAQYIGGIAAIGGFITNCSVYNLVIPGGNFTSNTFIGGIVGIYKANEYKTKICTKVTDCEVYDFFINNCTSTAVTYIGGITGYINPSVYDQYEEAYFHYVKGLNVYNMKVEDCTWSGGLYLGGIIGYGQQTVLVTLCNVQNLNINNVKTSKSSYVGGCVGYLTTVISTVTADYLITECEVTQFNLTKISGSTHYIGGIVGYALVGIKTCTVKNFDYGETNLLGVYTGGIVGYVKTQNYYYLDDCKVIDSFICGNAGGLVGYFYISTSAFTIFIRNNSVMDVIMPNTLGKTGGMIGQIKSYYEDSPIQLNNNFVQTDISHSSEDTSTNTVGTFVGYIDSNTKLTLNYCTFLGEVNSSSGSVGIVLGNNLGGVYLYDTLIRVKTTSTLVNSIDTASRNIFTIDGTSGKQYYINNYTSANSKTLTVLQTASTYTSWTDFSTYWSMDANINDGIPFITAHKDYMLVTDFDGSGTASDPYIIRNAQDLLACSQMYYENKAGVEVYWEIASELKQLDLSSIGSWIPIGSSFPFTGHFNGNKCNIVGLTVDKNYTYAGLFGHLASGASIEWLSVYGNIDYDIASYVGGLAGRLDKDAVISNCYFEGNITGYINTRLENNVGALVGYSVNNTVACSYADVTHTMHFGDTQISNKIPTVYVVGMPGQLAINLTVEDMEKLGFPTEWADGFTNTEFATANFSLRRSISGVGTILASAAGESVVFGDDGVSVKTYKKGTEIIVQAGTTINNGYAIKSVIIGETEYEYAANKKEITIVYNTANVGKVLPIEVIFDFQYTLTLADGINSQLGSISVTGANIDGTSPYNILNNTSINVTALAVTDNALQKSYITNIVIDGTPISLASTDSTITTHVINGVTYEIERDTRTGFGESEIISKITVTYTQTKSVTMSINYSAHQSVTTTVTLIGGDSSIPEGYEPQYENAQFNLGDEIVLSTQIDASELGDEYTFIGWAYVDEENGIKQIISSEMNYTTTVSSQLTKVAELWAVLHNVNIDIQNASMTSIQASHVGTGLSYTLVEGTKAMMEGEWLISVPTGAILKLNGTTVTPDGQGRYIVSISAEETITLI